MDNKKADWKVQIKGEKWSMPFEISIVRKSNKLGQRSYGWFDENKLLVSSSGGPCHDILTEKIWDKMVLLAQDVCAQMNKEEHMADEPSYEAEDIGCICNDSGMESEWAWNIEQGCYVCSGCGAVQ